MTDEASEPVHYDDPPTKRQWVKWAVTALLIGLPLLRLAWLIRPGDARQDILAGPDTTVVTGPLTPEGFIDFTAALNQQASQGVTTENNAVVLLMQAYGPGIIRLEYREQYFERLGVPAPPEHGKYLFDHSRFLVAKGVGKEEDHEFLRRLQEAETSAQDAPWTREQFPQYAELLEANQSSLEVVAAAAQRDRFFSPRVTGEDGDLLYIEQYQRIAARCLAARAMLRLGEGNADTAWADLLTCHRLARLTGQSPGVISMLVAYGLESVAVAGDEQLIASRLLTAEQARRCLAQYEALPPLPRAADVADTTGRLEEIQLFYSIAAGSGGAGNNAGGGTPDAERFYRAMDWNVILRMLNELIDDQVAAMRLPTAAEQKSEMARLEQLLNKNRMRVDAFLWALVGLNGPMSREIGGMLLDLASASYQNLPNAQLRLDARRQVTRIGFALATYEREHGAYPKSLDVLAPGYFAEVPLDPCSGTSFNYRRTPDGFLLYSIGENLIDDGGKTYEDVPPGRDKRPDDVRIRVGAAEQASPATE